MEQKLQTRGGAGRVGPLLRIGAAALCALPLAGFAQTWTGSFTGSAPSTFTAGASTFTTYVSSPYYGSVSVSTGGPALGVPYTSGTVSFNFFPLLSTTYTYAPSPPRTGGASVNVVVVPVPLIYEFTASTYHISSTNKCSTLNWRAVNVDHANIQVLGAVAVASDGTANGSQTVCTDYGQRYILTVYNALGVSTSAEVNIMYDQPYIPPPPSLPYISSFTSNASSVVAGSPATLAWTTGNASTVVVEGIGNVSASGTLAVYPTATTTYRLTAYGANNTTATSQVTVGVNAAPPQPALPYISSFTSNASSVIGGSPALLAWTTGNASTVVVEGIGNVSASGTLVVYPTATTTYRLTAYGANNTTSASQVTVSVLQDGVFENVTVNSGEVRRFEATASTRTGGGDGAPFIAKAGSSTFIAAIGNVILGPGTRLEAGTNTRAFSYYNSYIAGGVTYRPTTSADKNLLGGRPAGANQHALEGPDHLGLDQNTPNPFGATTLIRYSLMQPAPVSLRVYDLLGREVAQLVNEAKPIGTHEARFDADGLPGGVYLYRLQAGSYTQTKRMILVK
ncbi:T9SS type A sorting domain-containing protein [Hymenobacter sp.]|uniref:T9SS type A sorting domain-containing protein n=1 Tax=Hymenobacter sp. TaxID=1898978 RepID=UPI00286D0E49|nr:T9SS type A sorting domain-containing protein [Hymenobacter sp.]